MNKVILVRINVGKYGSNEKASKAQKKINEYIADKKINLVAASLFKENEDEYLFALTVK